jgi:hypothetical protein
MEQSLRLWLAGTILMVEDWILQNGVTVVPRLCSERLVKQKHHQMDQISIFML